MSDQRVEGLMTILQAEERLYLEMQDLLQRERELIAVLDATGVEEVVREKENLAEEGCLLEESRIEVSAHLAKSLGIRQEPPTLAAICSSLGESGLTLRDAHSRLASLAGAVQELLAANAAFAGDALGRVQGTLQLLGRLLPETPTYRPPGVSMPTVPHRAGRLVRQSA